VTDSTYTVTLTLGTDTWTINSTDAYNPALPVQIVTPLTVGFSIPGDDLWPAQPDPMRATIRLRALTAALVKGYGIGTPVALTITVPFMAHTVTVASFYGRVAQADLTPVKRGAGRQVFLDLVCVDYTADLAEVPLDAQHVPFEHISDRWARLTGQITGARPDLKFDALAPTAARDWYLQEADLDPTNALEALTALLALVVQWDSSGTVPATGLILQPLIVGGALDRFIPAALPLALAADQVFPGLVGLNAAGHLDVTISPHEPLAYTDRRGLVMDGCAVDLSGAWRQRKAQQTNTVRVSAVAYDADLAIQGQTPVNVSLTVTNGDSPAISAALDTQVAGSFKGPVVAPFVNWQAFANDLAAFYLPPSSGNDGADAWRFDAFTWRAHEDQDNLVKTARLVPDHTLRPTVSIKPEEWGPYAAPVIVTDLDPAIDPTGRGYYAGRLRAFTLTIDAKRKITAQADIRPGLPRGRSGFAVYTYAQAKSGFPAVSYTGVEDSASYRDFQLARQTN
jgi:hypothetical protein